MPKKIFTQKLERMRRRGRPRKGWREEAERDLQVLGVRRWRELVINSEKWRGTVRQAKTHSGLKRQRKKKKNNKSLISKISTFTKRWRSSGFDKINLSKDQAPFFPHCFTVHVDSVTSLLFQLMYTIYCTL